GKWPLRWVFEVSRGSTVGFFPFGIHRMADIGGALLERKSGGIVQRKIPSVLWIIRQREYCTLFVYRKLQDCTVRPYYQRRSTATNRSARCHTGRAYLGDIHHREFGTGAVELK